MPEDVRIVDPRFDEARKALMGAAVRGDRVAMADAAQVLADLVGGEPAGVLGEFIRHLFRLWDADTGVPTERIDEEFAELERLPVATLQVMAHKVAAIVYADRSVSDSVN